MPNIELEPPHELSTFRKIALGTWQDAFDPSVYGTIDVRMEKALDYIERFRAATGKRLTVSHLMARIAAAALERMPDANALIRFNRVYRRTRIGVFFQVAMTDQGDDKIDLSGATLYDVEQMSLEEIIDAFADKVQKVRSREDAELEKTRNAFKFVPHLLMNTVIKLVSFLSYTLNLDLRKIGIPKDPFGSIMITNVGSLGLDTAYVPLVPYSRVPMLLALGAVKRVPVAEGDDVVVAPVMRVHATFDHRFIDGYHAAVMSKVLKAWMADPEGHFGPIPGEG